MPAVAALRTALATLADRPILFVGGLASALVVLPQGAAGLAGLPIVPTALQALTFFITPFFTAGVLGMAHEALTAPTSLDTLVDRGRDRYVSMLLAYLFETAIVIAFGIVLTVVGIVSALVVLGSGAIGGGAVNVGAVAPVTVVVVGLVLGLLALAFVLVAFFIQFFPVAVVVENAGPVEAFSRSVGVVRANLLPTLGYSVITFLVGLLTSLPLTGFVLYRSLSNFQSLQGGTGGAGAGMGAPGATPQASLFSLPEVAALSLLSLVLGTLLTTFARTYAVAFFTRHADSPADRAEVDDGVADDPVDGAASPAVTDR